MPVCDCFQIGKLCKSDLASGSRVCTFASMTKKANMESNKSNQESPAIFLIGEDKLTEVLNRVLDEKFPNSTKPPVKEPDLLDDYIPKSAVRGKLLASSTLWKQERKGNLKTYAIGGKRYYKRSEIENLIQEVKK